MIHHVQFRWSSSALLPSGTITTVLRGLIYGKKANYYLEGPAEKAGM